MFPLARKDSLWSRGIRFFFFEAKRLLWIEKNVRVKSDSLSSNDLSSKDKS